MFEKISIIGCGLIGSSILRNIKDKKISKSVTIFDRSKDVVETIKKENLCDNISKDIQSAVKDADLVILAIPLSSYKEVLLSAKESFKKGAIVTDTGSVKKEVSKIFDNLNFFEKIKNNIETSKRPLLIFPQGTRVKFGEKIPFKKGAGRIYEALNLPCVPVALNTGKVWPKNSFLKYNHDIKISFLEPIGPGKDKNLFIKDLENKIYSSIDKIN